MIRIEQICGGKVWSSYTSSVSTRDRLPELRRTIAASDPQQDGWEVHVSVPRSIATEMRLGEKHGWVVSEDGTALALGAIIDDVLAAPRTTPCPGCGQMPRCVCVG